ncbi:MAG TPA: hypothetical protein PL037_06330, partial [Elusimicrobiales bacterium]|nr:hypothetical protein [Elusimicrobiales bacterium]
MKAVIFTEGGEGSGFGHVLRCSAIKSAFEEAGISVELLVQGDASVARVLGRRGYTASAWREGCAVRSAEGADIAVIDSYLAGPSVYRAIASAVRHCIYLDDNGRIAYPRGTVINYNAYGPAMRYPRRPGMEYLLGPSFAPLRREFLNVPDRSVRRQVHKALVLFGGADCAGITVKVLEFLSDSYPGMRKTAVIGAANRGADDIIRIGSGNVKLVRGAGPAEMRTLMRDCDIAFTGGGVTLYELARTGTPAVAFCTAPNQERNV